MPDLGSWIILAGTSSAFTPFSRKPVTTVLKPLEITLAGDLRASARFSLQVGKSSTLTQEIILDAACPYVRFVTEVWPAAAALGTCGVQAGPREAELCFRVMFPLISSSGASCCLSSPA